MKKTNRAVWARGKSAVVCPYLGGHTGCEFFEREGDMWSICKFKNAVTDECKSKEAALDLKLEAILEEL